MSIKNFLAVFSTILVLLVFTFILPQNAQAAPNFTTDYNVTYTVAESGLTHALLIVTLTNTTTQYYASSYKMQLGFDNITNVHVSDPEGPINPVIRENDDGYTIDLTFNKKAVGLGSSLKFNITFDTSTIAKKFGKIWEINIPGISNANDFAGFTVDVKTPASFGESTYIKPKQPNNALTFTKEQLGKSGISIAFGKSQIYAFHITYHLRNTNVYPIKTEIALPPSTNYQDVFLTNITPQPSNVYQDKDGNWLAQYKLLPSQKMDVAVLGKAEVRLTPKEQLLSQSELADYVTEKPNWQSKSAEIKELAGELKTPQAIYQYVINTLKYDFSRVTQDKPRLGAVNALKNQNSAVCREFTDLFIALARAAGIPAREIDGYAYTENSKQRPLSLVRDILHAWPEYYDSEKKTWIMVDPTWGSTTGGVDYFSVLDFDHFAFVVKGEDSTYPVPAGGYKYAEDKNSKDVQVTFADDLPEKTVDFQIATTIPKEVIAGLPISGQVIITNMGSIIIPSQVLGISSKFLLPHDQIMKVPGIPPYGYAQLDVGFRGTPILTNRQAAFTIRFRDKSVDQAAKIAPIFLTKWGIGGIVIVVLTIILFTIASKRRRVHVSR